MRAIHGPLIQLCSCLISDKPPPFSVALCTSRLVRFAGMIGGGRQGSSLYLLAGGSLYLVGCGPLYLVAATVRKERGTERCGRPNGALICPRLREGTATVVALCTSLPVALCPSLPAAFWRQNGGKSLAGMPGAPSLPSFPLYSVISWRLLLVA